MKEKFIEYLEGIIKKLKGGVEEYKSVVHITSEYQTKRKGVSGEEAKKMVIGQVLSQAKKHVNIQVLPGVDGRAKITGHLKISIKKRI